MSSHYDIM